MLATLKRLIAWLQSKLPKWYTGNSWVCEAGIGLVLTVLASWLVGGPLAVLLVNAASYAYERWLDPSADAPGHKPVDDIGQRAAGSLLAAWLWSLL